MFTSSEIVIVVAAIQLVLGLLVSWTFYKVRRVQIRQSMLATRTDLDFHYRQMEALRGLYVDLKLDRSLPPLRGYAASPDFLQVLVTLILQRRPSFVLELGSGSSTIVIARALSLCGGGKAVSLDHDARYAISTRALVASYGLQDFAVVLHAPLSEHDIRGSVYRWYSLRDLPNERFDILVVDGPPEATQSMARYPALPCLNGILADKSVILVDDATRPDELEMLQRWRLEFPGFSQESIPCEKGCVLLTRQ
jgi:predicted O-methyltransferase YrrM